MQFRNLFVTLFGTKAKAAVLQTLILSPAKQWTGRELAKAAGVSAPQTIEALDDLQKQGIVWGRPIGKSTWWTLNQKHIVIEALQPLAQIPERQKKILRKELEAFIDLSQVERVALYGSMARNEEKPSSDIDVLIVTKKAKDNQRIESKSRDFSLHMAERWGNIGSVIVYGPKEYKTKKRLPLIQNIEREGQLIYEATTHV